MLTRFPYAFVVLSDILLFLMNVFLQKQAEKTTHSRGKILWQWFTGARHPSRKQRDSSTRALVPLARMLDSRFLNFCSHFSFSFSRIVFSDSFSSVLKLKVLILCGFSGHGHCLGISLFYGMCVIKRLRGSWDD